MKLSIRTIALLVILSMTIVFAYQAYWLTSLYRTMHADMERSINEAIRLSDYNEMMLRVQNLRKDSAEQGEISISSGLDADGQRYVRSTTVVNNLSPIRKKWSMNVKVSRQDSHRLVGEDTILYDITKVVLDDKLTDEAKQDNTAKPTNAMFVMMDNNMQGIEKQQSLSALTNYFQRGMHSGLDYLAEPDIAVFEQFLSANLREAGITLPHRVELFQTGTTDDSSYTYTDTLGICTTDGYRPSPSAKVYRYDIDLYAHRFYHITTEPLTPLVISEMAGILFTSLVLLCVLGFSFFYLIRTILRQKTLEEMKSDFTNNITHELKTPIAVAYAANDALLNFSQAEDRAKRDNYLRICQEQLNRLSALVEQILSMSMERRKSFRLHPEELVVSEVLSPLIEQHKLKAEKPVRITLDMADGLTVLADRTHFANIVSNLIDNAIKYSPGEADIHIICQALTSSGVAEGEHREQVLISVEDKGIGISADRQKHIFEKFYRVPTGNLHNVKGYGLGLYYVKTMVERHGGSVEVWSEPGKGSEFIIRI